MLANFIDRSFAMKAVRFGGLAVLIERRVFVKPPEGPRVCLPTLSALLFLK
jgi:hypothetical protein